MSYLGGFMGGSPDYNSNPGILGLQQYIQSGFDAGRARGQNQALAQLSQKAYTDTGDAQKQDIAQAIGIDPQAGYALAGKAQEQNAAQQAQKLAAFQRLGKAASAIIQAKQSGDETTAEGIYQAIVPDLDAMSAQHGGPTPPPTLQGADMGALYKVAAMYASLPQPAKPISVGPDTTLLDGATHKVIYQGAGDAGTAVPGMTFNGMPVFRDKLGGLKDVRGNPIPQQGQQAASALAGGVSSALPAETQAYVPKVLGALGGAQPFDANGQPTPQLLDAVQHVESGGNPNAVSPAGAQGPYQFMPATAASVGVQNPFDQTQARAGATKYLAQLYQQFGGDASKAIAAYNAGPGRVSQATGAQPTGASSGGLQYNAGGNKAPPGYRFNADGSLSAIKGGPADKTVAGETPFAQLSPQDQALVQKVASYEILPTNLSNYVRQGQGLTRQQVLAYASVLRPDFNVNNADAASAYLKDMAKSSPTSIGGQTQSLNMILHHLTPMMQANAALSGTGSQWFNAAKNYAETKFNGNSPAGAAPGNWDQGKVFITQELGKLLKGGVAAEGEVRSLESKLDAAESPYQRSQALYNIADYVQGKISTMTDRRDKLLGSMAPKTSLLDAQAQQALRGAYQLGGVDPPDLLPPGTTYATGTGFNAPRQQPATAASGAPSGVDSLLSKYGIQ